MYIADEICPALSPCPNPVLSSTIKLLRDTQPIEYAGVNIREREDRYYLLSNTIVEMKRWNSWLVV